MWLLARQLSICLTLVSLCACQTFGGQPQRPYETVEKLEPKLVSFEKSTVDACIQSKQKDCRDIIIKDRLEVVDAYYEHFEREVAKLSEQTNVVGDVVVTVASAAATVVTGNQAKSILAAISSVSSGTKATVDKNFFFQKSAHVIIGRMRALRTEAVVRLREGLLKPADEYPLTQAILDVKRYFEAGTITAAVTDIEKSSQEQKDNAEKKIENILNVTFGTDDNSIIVRNFWKPGDDPDPLHDKALRDWLDRNVSKGFQPPVVVYAKEYSDVRKKILDTLINRYGADANTWKLRDFWKPNNKEDEQKTAALRNWIDTQVKKDLPIDEFLYTAEYADQRAKAVAALIPQGNPNS